MAQNAAPAPAGTGTGGSERPGQSDKQRNAAAEWNSSAGRKWQQQQWAAGAQKSVNKFSFVRIAHMQMSGEQFTKYIFKNRARACGFAICCDRDSLAGCTVGPNYHRPTAPVPATWDVQEPWRESAPKDAIPKGEWWAVFHDDQLSALEKQSLDANQTIKVAAAQIGAGARHRGGANIHVVSHCWMAARERRPTIERQRLSGNRPSRRHRRLPPARCCRIRPRCPSW